MRGRRLTTTAQLSISLHVSERTIYRDVRDLIGTGMPIEGEAVLGYRLRGGLDLPPFMLDREEIEALALGRALCKRGVRPHWLLRPKRRAHKLGRVNTN